MSRRAAVDEILAAAQHLDECYECRDRAAAVVDSGIGEIPHTRRRTFRTLEQPLKPAWWHRALPWIVVVLLILTLGLWLIPR